MRVYLAGPIADCDEKEADGWRQYAIKYLYQCSPYGITGVSPLRCEKPEDGAYEGGAAFKEIRERDYYKTARAISMKNKFDFDNCDVVLAVMPKEGREDKPSIGTLFEIAWAVKEGKPLFLVSDWDKLIYHPLLSENVAGVFKTLDDALDAIVGLLNVYRK